VGTRTQTRHPGPASRDQGGVRGGSGEGQERVKEGSREDQVANISTLLPYFTISLRLRLEDPFAKTIYFPHVKSLPGPG